MNDEKSFLEKYAQKPASLDKKDEERAFKKKFARVPNALTKTPAHSSASDTPQSPEEMILYPFKKAAEIADIIIDFTLYPETATSRLDYLQFIDKEAQKEKAEQQFQTEQHDAGVLLEKNISPIELNKMKHRFLQSSITLNKQIAEAAPDLPRTEQGKVDFEKCSAEQKQTVAKTVATFINKNPEYKKMLEGILERSVSKEEIKRDAMGLSVTFAANQKRSGR